MIMDYITETNRTFQSAVSPALVKSFHQDLKGKIKITCCGISQIVLNNELYEGKEKMRTKSYNDLYGATTATSLRSTDPWKFSGRIMLADGWFGSSKCAIQLWNVNTATNCYTATSW